MAQPKIDWMEPANRIQRAIVDGVECWKFSILKADPPLPWDVANNNRGPGGEINRRAMMSFAAADPKFKAQGPYNVKPGMLQTHGIRLRFGAGWPMNKGLSHDWNVPWQIHLPDDYRGNQWDGFHGISTHNGQVTFARPNDPNGTYFFRQDIEPERWGLHEYLMVTLWSHGANGFIKIVDPASKKILARYDGPTFPAGPFGASGVYMYGPMIGLYMDGTALTSDATIYIAGFEGPLPDIWDGDLTADATAPAPTPTPPAPTPPPPEPVTPAPPSPAKPSVDPEAAATLLMASIEQLDEIIAGAARVRDQAQELLDKGPYKPAG